jgi:ElaB/YqjD/DUF883 family membrane-anchored ribosome-binding protein
METNATKTTKAAVNTVNQAADALAEKFKDGQKVVGKKSEEAESMFADRFADIKDRAVEGYDGALSLVKEYPLYSFLGAAAVGLIAGAMIKRIGRD